MSYQTMKFLPTVIIPLIFLFNQPSMLPAEDIVDLDPFEVHGGPVIEQIELTGMADAKSIVRKTQIEELGAGNLAEALRRVPGVTISRYNVVGAFGGGDGGAIYLRGQGAGRPGAQIATLTDGIPRFVGVWTHPLLDTLPTDFARSIEVFKSPQPVRFGNMAFGAVNLLSARAMKPGWHGTAKGEYGAWNTRALYGDLRYKDERLNLFAGLSHRRSNGHRPNADGEVNTAQTRAAWSLHNNWKLSILAQWISSAANDPEPIGSNLPIVERYEVDNQFYLAQLQFNGEPWQYEAKLYLEAGELDWRQWHAAPPPPFPSQKLNTRTYYGNHGLHQNLTYRWRDNEISGGFETDSYGGRVTEDFAIAPDNRFNEERFHLNAPYARFSWNLPANVTFSAGARALFHDTFDNELAYQAGLKHSRNHLEWYINFAHSVNYPGVYTSVFGRRPPPWNVGQDWRALDAESVDHYEFGFHLDVNPNLAMDVAIFYDEVENALRIAPPPPNGRIFNLGEYKVGGTEVSFQASPHDNLNIFSSLTYLNAGEQVPNSPDWTFATGAVWSPFPRWKLSGDVQYVDEQRVIDTRFDNPRGSVAAYTLVNLRLSHTFSIRNHDFECYLRAENVFDEDYEHRPDYPMPGTSTTLGLKSTF